MAEEVIEDILWTSTAKVTFNNIVEYLRKEWTEKEVENFVTTTCELISNIRRFPEMCRPSLKRKNVRIGIVDKHTKLVYHYKPRKKQLEILLFWGFKQNPAKFKY
jgi:plasmid stabilization system protein ParE